jgi:hypothetical protein
MGASSSISIAIIGSGGAGDFDIVAHARQIAKFERSDSLEEADLGSAHLCVPKIRFCNIGGATSPLPRGPKFKKPLLNQLFAQFSHQASG